MTDHAKEVPAIDHPLAFGGALLVLLCALFALTAASSQAAVEATRTYAPRAFFGSEGSEPGQFAKHPGQIAAEPGTGNLLVTDTGNGRVQVFSTDATGNPAFLTTLGAGTLVTPVGIAVDPGTGAIYVSDTGAGEVFRFTSDGAPTPTYTLDATFTSPTLSSYASRLAVDPITHDLLVADTGSQEIRRFDVADGSELDSFNGADSPGGQFTALRGLAIGPSGRIYVNDELYPESLYFAGASRIERFEADGSPLGQLQGISLPGAVGVDPLSGTALGVESHEFFLDPGQVKFYEGSDSPTSHVNIPTNGGPVAAAVTDLGSSGFALLIEPTLDGQFGSPGIQAFKPADIPAAEVGPIDSITATTAHLTGSVAPGTRSGEGSAHFEYSLDGATWESTPDQMGINGPGATAVSADLDALRPNSTYSVWLKVANDDFTSVSEEASFKTVEVAPGVELGAASDRTSSSVTLHGGVNPFGQQTTYHFEYGTDDTYGSTIPLDHEDVAGAGYTMRPVQVGLSGLAPSTTYHYRLVATNGAGANATSDATFTTRSAGELTRAYEQVTPVDKRSLIVGVNNPTMAEANGDGLVYQVRHAINLPDTAGSVNAARYAAVRTGGNWELRQLDVPQEVSDQYADTIFNSTLAVSADFSHALVGSDLALAPGAVAGSGNLYRRDIDTGALEVVATGLKHGEVVMQTALSTYQGGSPDFSRIVIGTEPQLIPEAGPIPFQVYEWSTGHGLKVISTQPGGLPPAGASLATTSGFWPARGGVSADGDRVYFSQNELYLHEAGESRLVSPAGSAVSLLDATADGNYAAYLSGQNVYRFDREQNSTAFVGEVEFEQSFLGMSDDGSSIFLGSGNRPLTVWHEGSTSPIGGLAEPGESLSIGTGMAASPNGRYFVFAARSLVSSYDSVNLQRCGGRCREVYLYDVTAQKLACVSCPVDGGPPAGHAHLGATTAEFNHYGPPFVNDRGQVFFDTPTALVGADSNGRRDVYEYLDGEARLISPGTGDHEAILADASTDGDDVFFYTDEGLVGQDNDRQLDIYDARVGGGISAQSPLPAVGCTAADCRAPLAPPIAPPQLTSESVDGGSSAVRRKKSHRKKHGHRKRGKHRKKNQAMATGPSNRTIGE